MQPLALALAFPTITVLVRYLGITEGDVHRCFFNISTENLGGAWSLSALTSS